MEMSRREAMKTLAVGGLVLTGMESWAANIKEPPSLSLTTGEIKPIPLNFDPKKLSGISEKMIVSHWENNYGGSVKALNGVNAKLKEALTNKDTPPFVLGGLKREQLLRTGSVVNHDLYFQNLGGNGKLDGTIKSSISQVFGSSDHWESDFRKTAAALSGGSGWVILGYNYHLKTLANYWCYDHLHGPAATIPLLVMDMYEHSYQMDYGAAAAKYIDAFFANIKWDAVNERVEKVKGFI